MSEDNTTIELPDDDEVIITDDGSIAVPDEVETTPPEVKPDEEETYGSKVQRRINKLVSERNHERDERRRDSELSQRRIDDLEDRLNKYTTTQDVSEIDSRIADLKKQKLVHMRDGEFEEAETLNDEIFQLQIDKSNTVAPEREEVNNPPDDPPPVAEAPYVMPEAQKDWVDKNAWYKSSTSSSRSKYANTLYKELIEEGYDKDEPDLYDELDKRLNVTAANDNDEVTPPHVTPAPVQLVPDRGAAVRPSGKGKVKFTQRDIKRMREFSMDPNDPHQRAEWLKNKEAS